MNFNKDRVLKISKIIIYILTHTLWMSVVAAIVILIFIRCNLLIGPVVEEVESPTVEVNDDIIYIEPPVVEETAKHPEEVKIIVEKKISLSKTRTYYNVPLDRDLQDHIIDTCEVYGIDPALVISIIKKESEFTPGAVGDNGNSLGLMQIQPRYHSGRMYNLGCDNLLDPYQNVIVGVDLLSDIFAEGHSVEWTLMAYNGGYDYAYRNMNNGVVSSYARTVISYAEELRG